MGLIGNHQLIVGIKNGELEWQRCLVGHIAVIPQPLVGAIWSSRRFNAAKTINDIPAFKTHSEHVTPNMRETLEKKIPERGPRPGWQIQAAGGNAVTRGEW